MTVGHVTVDVIAADCTRRPGGGAFYSALQAARLGLRTLIVTQGSPPEIEALLEPYRRELELRIIPAPATTTLLTSWPRGRRTQQLLAWAGPIAGTIAVDTQILHFAPVAREIPVTWRGRADFVGLTPQGLVRTWDQGGAASGTIVPAPLPDDRGSLEVLLPHACSAVVISEQERARLRAASGRGGGDRRCDRDHSRPKRNERSDARRREHPGTGPHGRRAPRRLGAGDVFAAAFFVALHEGLSPERAAAFAGAAAAIRIEGAGADAIGDRSAIEARLLPANRLGALAFGRAFRLLIVSPPGLGAGSFFTLTRRADSAASASSRSCPARPASAPSQPHARSASSRLPPTGAISTTDTRACGASSCTIR